MAVNTELVGRVYPPDVVVEVGREAIREFAEATSGGGPVHPAYTDPDAARALGHADVVAPPTFAVTIAQRSDRRVLLDPSSGVDYSRLVHGEQSFVHHRPMRPGDRVVATLHVDGVRSVAGNDIVTTRSELATEQGEALCTAVSVLVIRAAS